MNTNLPGHSGWIRNRMVAGGWYEEVAAGVLDGTQWESVMTSDRAWAVLARREEQAPANAWLRPS